MEYTRDEIFSVDYEENVSKIRDKRHFITNAIGKILRHKIITVAFVSFLLFSGLNFFLIYKFVEIFKII